MSAIMDSVARISSSINPCTVLQHTPPSPAKSETSTDSKYSSSSSSSSEESSVISAPEPISPIISTPEPISPIATAPEVIGPYIYKNPGGSPCLPNSLYCGLYHHIASPGNVWVNKLAFCLHLEYQCSASRVKLPTFHCPKGFGKTAFLDMAAFQNDTSRVDEYSEYFGASPIPEDEDRLVLCLDFGEFHPSANPQRLRRALDAHITSTLRLFLEQYGHILGVPEENIRDYVEEAGGKSFDAVLRLLRVPYTRLYVFVDNFNLPLVHCKPADVDAVTWLLEQYLVWPIRDGIDSGLINGGCFFGRPKNEIPAYAMMSHEIFDFVCVDLSDDDDMAGAVGLAEPEIKALAREILGDGEDAFFAKVEKALKPYFMADTARYSFTGVFGLLKKQIGQEDPQLQTGVTERFDDPYSIAHEDEC